MSERGSEAVRLRGWRLIGRSASATFHRHEIALTIALPLVIWGSTVESRLSVLQTVQSLLAARQDRTAEDLKERPDRDALDRRQCAHGQPLACWPSRPGGEYLVLLIPAPEALPEVVPIAARHREPLTPSGRSQCTT